MHRSLSDPKGPQSPCLVMESLNERPNTAQKNLPVTWEQEGCESLHPVRCP